MVDHHGVPPLDLDAPPLDISVEHLLRPGAVRAVVQPIVRLADGEVVGYEALSRATGAVAGTPDRWFAAARRRGLLVDLELACLDAVAAVGPPPGGALLFVNVSPLAVGDPRLLELRGRLPERLVLELTERDAVADIDALHGQLARWTTQGTRIALDDTGAGYASLQQVLHLRPEFLKLDRGLITGIDRDRPRQALVAAVVAFAREVGATVIAEGVETMQELRWLRDAGVALAQGYLLARPAPPWPRPAATSASKPSTASRARDLYDRLVHAHTYRAACEAVADHLHQLGGLMPSVYLEADGRLRCYAQRGLWQVLDGMAPTAGITGRCFRTGATHHLPDVGLDPDYLEAIPGVVAELCTPIRTGDAVVGALNVESLVPLEASTLRHVERCAELLGARLGELPVETAGIAVRRLAAVATSLIDTTDPSRIASATVAAACELAGTDSGAVLLGSVDAGFELAAAAGPLRDALASTSPADVVHLARMLAPLSSCYSSGDATGLTWVGGTALRAAGARSVIVLPLVAAGARTGLLLLANSRPLALGPEIVEPLELLAIIAGAHLRGG